MPKKQLFARCAKTFVYGRLYLMNEKIEECIYPAASTKLILQVLIKYRRVVISP